VEFPKAYIDHFAILQKATLRKMLGVFKNYANFNHGNRGRDSININQIGKILQKITNKNFANGLIPFSVVGLRCLGAYQGPRDSSR
jgi:hypothetical protein